MIACPVKVSAVVIELRAQTAGMVSGWQLKI
jgi:hypothetical protein